MSQIVVNLPFEREEYAQRLAKVRAAMQVQGIELLLVTDPSNMAWLTGYDGWSFYVHQCVLLALDGEPLWFGRGQDANGAKRTVFMQHENIVGYPDIYVQSRERHPMDYLSREVISARGWDALTIGVEMDNYYFSAAAYLSLKKNLPKANLIDAVGLVNWQRAIKSPQEIAYMRIAARIVENMHGRILERIEPGMRKNELVAEIYTSLFVGSGFEASEKVLLGKQHGQVGGKARHRVLLNRAGKWQSVHRCRPGPGLRIR